MTNDDLAAIVREAFEAFIKAPPFEEITLRYPNDETKYAWPGQYRNSRVQLAWEAWQEAYRLAVQRTAEACARACVDEALSHSYDEEHREPFYDCAAACRRIGGGE